MGGRHPLRPRSQKGAHKTAEVIGGLFIHLFKLYPEPFPLFSPVSYFTGNDYVLGDTRDCKCEHQGRINRQVMKPFGILHQAAPQRNVFCPSGGHRSHILHFHRRNKTGMASLFAHTNAFSAAAGRLARTVSIPYNKSRVKKKCRRARLLRAACRNHVRRPLSGIGSCFLPEMYSIVKHRMKADTERSRAGCSVGCMKQDARTAGNPISHAALRIELRDREYLSL